MGKALALSPLYILIMTLVGATLGGFVGVLIAVPAASIINIFYQDWIQHK